jgi:hypothetical protein
VSVTCFAKNRFDPLQSGIRRARLYGVSEADAQIAGRTEQTMKKHEDDLELDPNQIFRPREAAKYFGYKHTQLAEKIKNGEIDPPIPLSDSGRAVGFTGRQIIEHHRRRLAAATKRRSRAAAEQGGNDA